MGRTGATRTTPTPHARTNSMPADVPSFLVVARQAVAQPTKPQIYLYELSKFLELPKAGVASPKVEQG